MKKIVFTVMIILFIATGTGYAQFFNNQETETTTEQKDSPSSCSDEVSNSQGFFRAGDASDPGGRPGSGGGIGQESQAPLKDGIGILVTCSVIFVFIKTYKRRRKNTD